MTWRSAGLRESFESGYLPFFIAWDLGVEHPGRALAQHKGSVHDVAGVEVSGDAARVRSWLGGDLSSARLTDGPPRIRAVAITTDDGEILLH